MKKWVKITLISLGSLLGLVIIVLAIAMYLVFTPARLTSIVNKVSDNFIVCEHDFEKVNLTLIRTFPHAGLVVDNAILINPTVGAPSDTLANLHQLTVAINAREFIRHKHIKVENLLIDGIDANLMVAADGKSNFDVFVTKEKDDEETEIPDIYLNKIKIKNLNLVLNNHEKGLFATVADAKINVKGYLKKTVTDAYANVDADKVSIYTNDKIMKKEVQSELKDVNLQIDAKGDFNKILNGNLHIKVDKGDVCVNGENYVTEALRQQEKAFLEADIPFKLNEKSQIYAVEAGFAITQFGVKLKADVTIPNEEHELAIESDFRTSNWDIKELLNVLPEDVTKQLKGMDIGALAQFKGHASYSTDTTFESAVSAHVIIDKGKFIARQILPFNLSRIGADMKVYIGLSKQPSWADVQRLEAHSGRNMIKVTGRVDDLLGAMNMNLCVNSHLRLADLMPLIPDSLNIDANGNADLRLHARTNKDQVMDKKISKMKVNGTIALADFNLQYDSILAESDKLELDVNLPAKRHTDNFKEMLSADVTSGMVHTIVPSAKLDANLQAADVSVGVSDFMNTKQPLNIAATFKFDNLHADMDTITAEINQPKGSFEMVADKFNKNRIKYNVDYTSRTILATLGKKLNINVAGLTIKGDADYDSTRSNVLKQWSPNLNVEVMRGVVSTNQLPYSLQMPDLKFNYKPEICEINSANLVFGNSDFYLTGQVTGLEDWISHEDMLRGDLNFTSNYTNVDDLMDVLSGFGNDKDTLNQMREEDNVAKEADPFIVPKDVNFTLHTNIREARAFDNDLQNLAGDIIISDGIAVLDQVGFVCKAATMQLTALYKTPRPNHIFLGADFHLLDIDIDELIDMIPYVDTLLPMLTSFKGGADFHLAAETYLNAMYQPKMSTMRGAAAISARDLVVLDNETFNQIAKLMRFKKKTQNKFDSLDVEMTLFKDEIEMFPSMLSMDKYQVCVSGFQSLKNDCNYHLELLKSPLPLRLAVNVKGIKPFKIKLGKVQYADLYRPEKRNVVEERTLNLKQMIRSSLEDNVRQSTQEMRKEID